ncbi:RNA-directed DNA polymerase from mobile element jockey [Trichonephila clavipes]|nr:RNA-directed DNA polymerase from mobile element jockey [Trichonephila clavipes]
MLESERPLKLILRGLPTSTEHEAVKKEIDSEGLKINKSSRLTTFQSKAPMPLIYIQLVNDLNADSMYNYVNMFGTRIAFEPYDGSRNRWPKQCWRCQGFFHNSEDPLKCTNYGGEQAANWRQCPRFPKSKKAPNYQNQGGNIKNNNNPKPSNKNINQRNQNTAPEETPSSQNLKNNNQLRVRSNSTRAQLRPNAHSLTFNSNVQSLSICFWNANGLRPKICEIHEFVSEQNPDLFLVQETKLQPGLDPLIANYRLHKDDRNYFPHTRTNGGTAIYCKNNYDHNRVSLLTLQYMDATAIEIEFNNPPPIRIVSAYARNTTENNSKLPDKDFLKIFNSGQNIIIAGDLNAAHRARSNARSNAFGYALCKIVNNKLALDRGQKLLLLI